jgi:Tfp pilus assembly protein PilN
MASLAGKGKSVIGLFIDGLDVKLARLSLRRKQVVVEELKTATLVSRLHESKIADITAGGLDTSDAFNLGAGGSTETVADGVSEDNNAVLIGLFSQYPRNKYPVTYSLAEPAIYYHVLESDFGLKGKKLKDRILEELKSIRSFQPAADAVDAIKTDEGNLLCIVREDGLSLINALENIKGFIGNRLPVIPAIDSADVSLMNMVRQNYQLEPHEVTVVIYVGVEFTRLIFMRGSHFYQFAPIIGEGYDSPNLQNTVYSRLLLEQDNLAIPQIGRIVLAGQCRRIGFKEFLTQQLPDQEIDYLLAPNVDSSALPMEEQESISEFAVPIGAAMKALIPADKNIYNVNLLPASVREGQRVFKLAWHGYLLLVLLFASTFFFTWQVAKYSKQIRDLRDELTLKESQRAENITLASSIQALEEQLTRYQASMALYDSLVPGAERFSKVLTSLSHGVEDLNSIWLTDLSSGTDGNMDLNGFALYRTRIPRLSTLFENALLEEVNVQEIRKETVYKYRIKVPPQIAAVVTDQNQVKE